MGESGHTLETGSTNPIVTPHPEPMDKVDWKFVLVLGVHLLAVGAMYGRITSDVSSISEKVGEQKQVIDAVKNSMDTLTQKIIVLETRRDGDAKAITDSSGRLGRLEKDFWERNDKRN